MRCCDIWEVFGEGNNLIKEYRYWKLLVSNRARTLGNSVAILKRHAERFSDLTDEEMLDFAALVRETEAALKKAFGYDKINWVMLMMKDRHLHLHIFPRYKEPRDFAGIRWEDGLGGNPLELDKKNPPQEVLNQIRDGIRKRLPEHEK